MATFQSIIVDLGAPDSNPERIAFARTVLHLMDGNLRFPNPPVSMAQLKSHIDIYEADQLKAGLRTNGMAAQRDASRGLVSQDLALLRAYVQSIAQASPNEAAAIAASAGMSLRQPPNRTRQGFIVRALGGGAVELSTKAVATAAVYYWQFSEDGETWQSAPETMRASTTISGLTPHKLFYFRFRALTRKGPIDYSQVVSQLVA